MVLPPSPADEAPGSGWLNSLGRIMRLGRAYSVLSLVVDARPAQLRRLVGALRAIEPELRVCPRASDIVGCEAGATVLYRFDPADTAWLNGNRPLFSERRLRVVLWVEGDDIVALKQGAPDFYDWISHTVDCPDAAPEFAVRGLRTAPAHIPIVWLGGDLEPVFRAAFPDTEIVYQSAEANYTELLRAAESPAWLVYTDVRNLRDLSRMRFAMAEVGRVGRCIAITPPRGAPGWWPVAGRPLSWAAAAAELSDVMAGQAGLCAALIDLEPDAVQLVRDLVADGVSAPEIIECLGGDDPMVGLTVMARERELVDFASAARLDADPSVMRSLVGDPGFQAAGVRLCEDVEAKLVAWRQRVPASRWASELPAPTWDFPADDMAVWANHQSESAASITPLPWLRPPRPGTGYWLEAALRAVGDGDDWDVLVAWAHGLGFYEVAEHWGATHEVKPRWRASLFYGRIRQAEHEQRLRAALADDDICGDERQRAAYLLELANLLSVGDRLDEAEALCSEALSLYEGTLGRQHRLSGQCLVRLGEYLLGRNKYGQANEALDRARPILVQTVGAWYPLAAEHLRIRGQLAHAQAKYAQAEEYVREAVKVTRELQGEEHFGLSLVLSLLAFVLLSEQAVDAEALLRQAETVQRHVLRSRDPWHIWTLLARALLGQGRQNEAEDLARKAVASVRRECGDVSSDHGAAQLTLALVLFFRGEFRQAEGAARQAAAVLQRTVGELHLLHAQALSLLATSLAARKLYPEAEEKAYLAVAIAESTVGPEHPEYAELLENLALILEAQGKREEAVAFWPEVLGILERFHGPESERLFQTLGFFASHLATRGEYAEAEHMATRALRIAEGHSSTLSTAPIQELLTRIRSRRPS